MFLYFELNPGPYIQRTRSIRSDLGLPNTHNAHEDPDHNFDQICESSSKIVKSTSCLL